MNRVIEFFNGLASKLLTSFVTALFTLVVATGVTQASDIEIYQEAKSGDITLMLMLDISGSMDTRSIRNDYGTSSNCNFTTDTAPGGYSRSYCAVASNTTSTKVKNTKTGCTLVGSTYRCYDRISRLKDGVFDLLAGNTAKGITKLDGDKIIGLSTLGVYTGNSYHNTGRVLVPARKLNATYGGQTQRDILLSYVKDLSASTNTPTARSYAETIAYIMGQTTASRYYNVTDMPYYRSFVYYGDTYVQQCTSWNSGFSSCSRWSNASTSISVPTGDAYAGYRCNFSNYSNNICYYYTGVIQAANSNSGFSYSLDTTKLAPANEVYEMPSSLSQTDDIKQCSGQGVYVLTDGEPTQDSGSLPLMQGALGLKGMSFTCDDSGSWDCIHKMATTLLTPASNPIGLKVKTAVVGFGSDFNGVTSYDRTKTQEQNIEALGTIDTNVKRAAYWGIIGEGGWYSGSSSQDVVDSVNAFIDSLGTDIPAVTTGSPTVPTDALNPTTLLNDAYYQQFQPTPEKSYQLWVGNLKKYKLDSSGILKGENNEDVIDDDGTLIEPTYDDSTGRLLTAVYDYWSADVNSAVADSDIDVIGSRKFAAKGGAWSQLKLRLNDAGNVQRKLLTNRKATGSGSNATFGNGSSLRRFTLDDLTDSTYKYDANRGYLVSLLGYAVDDASKPEDITATTLASNGELRQFGAVMHSLPILVTNKGKVAYNKTTKVVTSTNREDYILFGTTQGLLHVVDAKTGAEKFAFVPNEMVEKQKEAFVDYTKTSGGVESMFYGIDGPWVLHTEYVLDSSGNLVVGSGKGTNQKGKQIAYGGLRMGGRSYYALDLADIDSPSLKFHINPDGVTSGPLSHMGQSWSKPTLAYVNWGGKKKLVMFVGGGYDPEYEKSNYVQTNKKGAGVYMFSADGSDAGDLLWWASANASTSSAGTTSGTIGTGNSDMKYSVVSEIRAEDRNGDDLVDHLYFGDLGGQVFRVDLNNKATAIGSFAKATVRLLNLTANASKGTQPRFYDKPAFSLYRSNGTTFAAISIGSGNRSTPLLSYTAGTSGVDYDAVYTIYDKDVARTDLYSTSTYNTKDMTLSNLGLITNNNRGDDTSLVAPFATTGGWYYQFKTCKTGINGDTKCSDYKVQSEKVYGTPIVTNYRMYVPTFDSSKPGISGDCGAGVKGESFAASFCMPYGQCEKVLDDDGNIIIRDPPEDVPIGIGIQEPVITSNCSDDGTCPIIEDDDEDEKPKTSAENYCIDTGTRVPTALTGPLNGGDDTRSCLIPLRWFEKLSRTTS
ncbi:PilC beta-propeller domain-containing protein [Acinetobacter marinus]|uniref:PilC beta-propeller domain-containing protein n=1 Tax=Acinetobacter marinus TaxID=281375 RepID=A0A1G6KHD2_9GAMM|nr:PilC/PilY family type IV pilus protein [Acinetobacter marinus]SDC30440.1 PilC beta-propeller domain-containing protein [Acinetobacter marinus]